MHLFLFPVLAKALVKLIDDYECIIWVVGFVYNVCLHCNIVGVCWISQKYMGFLASVFAMNRLVKRPTGQTYLDTPRSPRITYDRSILYAANAMNLYQARTILIMFSVLIISSYMP